jgi:hypothetical protein
VLLVVAVGTLSVTTWLAPAGRRRG